jgi:hypothetical protein
MPQPLPQLLHVMPGPDPGIQEPQAPLCVAVDRRVKPGDDEVIVGLAS